MYNIHIFYHGDLVGDFWQLHHAGMHTHTYTNTVCTYIYTLCVYTYIDIIHT